MSSSSNASSLPPLIIAFEDDVREVAPGDSCTFGRAGDIEIDSANRLLHRVLGRFEASPRGVHGDLSSGAQWWLVNEGRTVPLLITDLESASYTRVVAGSSLPLPFRQASVSFTAGRAHYRLTTRTDAVVGPVAGGPPIDHHGGGDATLTTGVLVFNEEQFALLEALAGPRLDGPITERDLPTNRALAHELGWTITKFNRKLDNLCLKLSRAGVEGLQGSVADMAVDRRLQLANFVVEHGIVEPPSR